ncbi:MAG: ATP-binding protein, partial [Candidatus Thermoplasmatota archaeon]
LVDFKPEKLDLVLQAFYELYGSNIDYVVLDEIQNVERWELFANRLRRTKKVILTGSNSKLLSGELATRLTGRYSDFTLYPFSFQEFLALKGKTPSREALYSTKKISEIKNLVRDYISLGGFPEVHKFGKSILLKTYEDIIQRDILLRYRIRNKTTFKELSKYLMSNVAQEITFTKLKNIIAVKNVHTIKNYIDYLSTAYLFFIIERFSFKLKHHMIAPKKIYCIDTGIINTVSFKVSENFGKLMENVVAVDLLRRKSYWDPESELYYWKDHRQREVDFVIKKGPRVQQAIQVTSASDEGEVADREYTALLSSSKDLHCNNLLVITWDYEAKKTIDGKQIYHIPLWKWLLSS